MYYYTSHGEYYICDIESCSDSERTIDIPMFELANNAAILDKLHLHYFGWGNFGGRMSFDERVKHFCVYLTAFFINEDIKKDSRKKALSNPMVRLLIENKDLYE